MKILHLLASNSFSGAENVVCQIIDMFKQDSNIEMIYCSPDGSIRDALYDRQIRFAPISKLTCFELKRIIREEKPDMIHAHDMRASFVAACSCGSIPFVSHIHGNFAGLNKPTPKAFAYAYAAQRAKHIFWVSKSSYDNYVFKRLAKRKSSVLYNVINADSLYKKMLLDSNTYNYDVVFLGRLTWEKNPERLIRVLNLLIQKRPETRAAIIGTGDLEEKTRQLVEELNLTSNIDFLGFKSNPLKILHDSKVMLMTSIREGTPMCALEAMALGVPIVSTPTDGMKDLVIDGETGFLSNDDKVLCENIFRILCDHNLHSNLSKRAKVQIEVNNNVSVYKKNIEKVYI